MDKMILASASPRRRELLQQIGVEFEVKVSEADETVEEGLMPWKVVEELSARKAAAVWKELDKKKTVIGADTVVALDDRILGKPKSEENAIDMIKLIRNRAHMVYTGVTVLFQNGERITFHEGTKVHVSAISDAQVEEYVRTGDPMDKAGAYGIQGFFARYIRQIEGDYNNVVGLPAGRLYRELERHGRKSAEKRIAIFDLDGTLSDSIASMRYSGNEALSEFGLAPFEDKDYKYFVGDGAANLVKRMLLASGDLNLTLYEKMLQRYKEIFAKHCMDGVRPYEGIRELLRALKEKGLCLAVLSNKPHAESVRVVETLFGKGVFDVIQGQEEDLPIKPDPHGVFRILERLERQTGQGFLPENALYLGDTGTDMQTGRNAGAYTVGALWGFREQEELLEFGADELISKPMELMHALDYVNM